MTVIKKQLFEQLALIANCLSSPQRVEMIDYLSQAECGVDELSRLIGASVANTSRHLQILKQNGLVVMRKQGKNRLYQLAGDDVVRLISSLRSTAETHLAQVDRLLDAMHGTTDAIPTISSQQLAEQFSDRRWLILDVRPEREFSQGHIQGAINVQPEDIAQATQNLPGDKTVVAYCRGPYCVYSFEMVAALKQKGITALRLEEGFPEWKAAGLPYELSILTE